MSVVAKVSGANTRAEIFSQPQCWKACFQALEKSQQLEKLATKFRPDTDSLFIGCGSRANEPDSGHSFSISRSMVKEERADARGWRLRPFEPRSHDRGHRPRHLLPVEQTQRRGTATVGRAGAAGLCSNSNTPEENRVVVWRAGRRHR